MSEKKYEDWDKIINEKQKNNNDNSSSQKINSPIENGNVNPSMTGAETFWSWALIIGGCYFIWRGFTVVIGITLNLIIGFSLFLGAIIINYSVKNRIRASQNIAHRCTNCGKTMYITQPQENYVKSGNKIKCPHCGLDSD